MAEHVGKNVDETLSMLRREFPEVRPWAAAAAVPCRRCEVSKGYACFGRLFSTPHATRYRTALRALRAERTASADGGSEAKS